MFEYFKINLFSFIKTKKAISPVVSMALLLVVAVISVVVFQNWFNSFSDEVFVDVESQSSNDSLASIETLIGDNLFVKSKDNLSINSVSVNGIDCNNFDRNIFGFDSLNLSDCLENVSGKIEILILTNRGVLGGYEYIGNDELNSESSDLEGDLFVPGNYISCPNNVGNFYGGDGSFGNPYQICSCQQLQDISTNNRANYTLVADIDCSISKTWNGGEGFIPISDLRGHIDGQGYKIDYFFINRNANEQALLANVWGSNVSNIFFRQANVTGLNNVGVLASQGGHNYKKIKVTGVVSGQDYVGGLVGNDGTGGFFYYDGVSFEGDVVGRDYVGLFSGGMGNRINNSYFSGSVLGRNRVGGLTGYVGNGFDWIHNSYIKAEVSGNGSIGGLYGMACGRTMSGIFFDVSILGNGDVGSFVGDSCSDFGLVTNSFWLNTSNNPSFVFGTDSSSVSGLFAVTDVNYLTNPSNEPFASFDSSIWSLSFGDEPKFVWE